MIATSKKVLIHSNHYYVQHQAEPSVDNSLTILFIHGIGESGLCFKEAIEFHDLLKLGTLIIPDLPGFGASSYANIDAQSDYMNIVVTFLLNILNNLANKNNNIVLVSHSAGNIIALNLISYLKDRLVAYIDLDGLYEKETWRYSTYVHQYKSARTFYDQAHKNLVEDIKSFPTEYLLRYYSSFIRSSYEAFYHYAKLAQKFLSVKKNYICLGKEKHLFISSNKIRQGLVDYLSTKGIRTNKLAHLGHWALIEEPSKFYHMLIDWVLVCTSIVENK